MKNIKYTINIIKKLPVIKLLISVTNAYFMFECTDFSWL